MTQSKHAQTPDQSPIAALLLMQGTEQTSASIDSLHPWEGNPRTDVNDGDVEELKAALLEAGGYIHDVSVLVRDGKNCVFIGGRRLRAARELVAEGKLPGSFKLTIKLHHGISDEDALELANQENIARKDMNALDVMSYVLSHRSTPSVDLARRTGMSPAAIESLLLVSDTGNENITAALREGKIGPDMAAILCSLPERDRDMNLGHVLKGAVTRTALLSQVRRTGITMEAAMFDPALYTGRLDQAFGLLNYGGTRIADDEDSREQWLALQLEAAQAKAEEMSPRGRYEGGLSVIAEAGTSLKTIGYKQALGARRGYVLALINPHTGVASYTYGVLPINEQTTRLPTEAAPFQPTEKTQAAARVSVTTHVTAALSGLDAAEQERYALALSVTQRLSGLPFLIGRDHQTLKLSIPGLTEASAEAGVNSSLDLPPVMLRHLLTLDTDTLRRLNTEVTLSSVSYRNNSARYIMATLIDLTGAAPVVPMDEAYLETMNTADLKALTHLMPVKPAGTAHTRGARIKAILAVAEANVLAGFQPPTHQLAGTNTTAIKQVFVPGAAPVAVEVSPEETEVLDSDEAEETQSEVEVEEPEVEAADETPESEVPTAEPEVAAEQPEVAVVAAEEPEVAAVAGEEPAVSLDAVQVPELAVTSTQILSDAQAAPAVCASCGNTREIWDEEAGDTAPCPSCVTSAIQA